MAAQTAQELVPITLEAVATRVGDRWRIDVMSGRHLSVCVESLHDVEGALNDAIARAGRRKSDALVGVHILWYRYRDLCG